MKTIFDIYSKEDIENRISQINELLKQNISDNEILSQLDFEMKEELFSIAKARIKSSKEGRKHIEKIKFLNMDDLRFSTPTDVAYHRAKRLQCSKIVDLCSGMGIQSFAFSKECKEAYAFEIDERKVEYAKENFKKENLHFFQGDVLSKEVIEQIKKIKPDIIFCDPERIESEKERTINSIAPNIKKLIEVYSKITENLCLEIPPQIDLSKLKELGDFEAEYLSYDNKLNRLNIYFGKLKQAELSVADVSGYKITKNEKIKSFQANEPLRYIYECSTAIAKAELENEICQELKGFALSRKPLLVTSKEFIKNPLAKIFEVLDIADDFESTVRILRKFNIGKVVLRQNIDPKEYWQERKKYEMKLTGKEEAHLFVLARQNLICREI
jgi:16S rRNA G966 N2-methylase RsmD